MLELKQFRHSSFCLKVRMVLQAKNLKYRVVEIIPGIGQIGIFRLSGQRQVPVLVDGENVVADSSTIIRYIETEHPNPKLMPDNPKQAAQVHLIEDWADTTLAKAVNQSLLNAAAIDRELRICLLPKEVPISLSQLMGNFPSQLISHTSQLLQQNQSQDLLSSLEHLSKLIQNNQWLVGDQMSFADIAIAAQLSLLRFPKSSGEPLAGKGCPGFSDHPNLQVLFDWRDRIETTLMQSDLEQSPKTKGND